jgi:hypothetical protein
MEDLGLSGLFQLTPKFHHFLQLRASDCFLCRINALKKTKISEDSSLPQRRCITKLKTRIVFVALLYSMPGITRILLELAYWLNSIARFPSFYRTTNLNGHGMPQRSSWVIFCV